MGAPFRFDRSWRFDVEPDALWAALADTTSYPSIFSWLDDFQAGPLATGTVARFRVRPPLPYSLRFVVTLEEVIDGSHVRARVGGDACGEAELVVTPAENGSRARLRWDLELVRPSLARLEPVARRPMIWGHDLVVAMGVRQFKRRALR